MLPKDICVETEKVCCNIESAVNQNVFLKSTRVVNDENLVRRDQGEVLTELHAARL